MVGRQWFFHGTLNLFPYSSKNIYSFEAADSIYTVLDLWGFGYGTIWRLSLSY